MGPYSKSIGIGFVSMELDHPYIRAKRKREGRSLIPISAMDRFPTLKGRLVDYNSM